MNYSVAGLRWGFSEETLVQRLRRVGVGQTGQMGKDTAGRGHREGKKWGVERWGGVSGEAEKKMSPEWGVGTGVRRVPDPQPRMQITAGQSLPVSDP